MRLGAVLVFAVLLMACVAEQITHHHRKRFQRNPRRKDYRKIRSAADCGLHEKFTTCGPEPHCEISCDNLFAPPRCQADLTNPRCYFPRCVCEPGYVRDTDGRRCVAEWRCEMEHRRPHHRHVGSPAAAARSSKVKAIPHIFGRKRNNDNNWW